MQEEGSVIQASALRRCACQALGEGTLALRFKLRPRERMLTKLRFLDRAPATITATVASATAAHDALTFFRAHTTSPGESVHYMWPPCYPIIARGRGTQRCSAWAAAMLTKPSHTYEYTPLVFWLLRYYLLLSGCAHTELHNSGCSRPGSAEVVGICARWCFFLFPSPQPHRNNCRYRGLVDRSDRYSCRLDGLLAVYFSSKIQFPCEILLSATAR